ncbi:MAG: hypothetical protein GXO40_00200 [Epsilonproteobacteria bacterium]|nr:hypothetical protein [Campylobacterota bacterium]
MLHKILGRLFYSIDKRRRGVVITNLNLVFKDMPIHQKKQLLHKVYDNFAYNLLDILKNKNITKTQLKQKVEIEGLEEVQKYLDKPVIFISAHYGNWELIASVIGGVLEIPLTVIIREKSYKLKFINQFLLKFISKYRHKFNIQTIDKKGALKGLMKAIKEGRSVGLFVDQNTAKNEGVDVEMFGLKALQTPSAALLSKKFNIPIIPVFITRDKNKYKLIFKKPILEQDIHKSTQMQSDVIEEMIRQRPHEWYWFHRRFKHYYEDEYQKDKIMLQ